MFLCYRVNQVWGFFFYYLFNEISSLNQRFENSYVYTIGQNFTVLQMTSNDFKTNCEKKSSIGLTMSDGVGHDWLGSDGVGHGRLGSDGVRHGRLGSDGVGQDWFGSDGVVRGWLGLYGVGHG